MYGDSAVSIVFILGALVLVGSSLLVRRMPARSMLRMAVVWALIFGLGAALVYYLGIRF